MPGSGKKAVVSSALGVVKVTVPGPLTWVHVTVGVGAGRPSSVTVPSRSVLSGHAIIWPGPASTSGGWFSGWTVTVSWSLAVSSPSSAVS